MPDTNARYRLNAPEVVSETLDGEALIVHLGTGSYFSCRGAAEAIWAQLMAGRTAAEAAETLAAHYGSPATLGADVERFLGEVLAEALLVPSDAAAGGTPETTPSTTSYERPELSKYTDMQELLALDPVHDVDQEEGWPVLNKPATP